ncbi:ASCH domain-containing protein [Desulfofundulus thermosubterraneus]|uniref:ASCH domain-containing protein n=1 Tax=Desulfofundulus thermosubterraneus DSM 16057 TaxID=1121432 RepID=A0A1M6GZF5_9FIRM|nr:hypothetical protein SAMN02745219_01860 [Desulfofundulus thermosubterraneus DSM 16057]
MAEGSWGGRALILFKPEHVEPILPSHKTQTRRLGKKRWKAGSVHQCRLNYRAEPFAYVKVTAVRRERLGDITEEDARKEGYPFGGCVPGSVQGDIRLLGAGCQGMGGGIRAGRAISTILEFCQGYFTFFSFTMPPEYFFHRQWQRHSLWISTVQWSSVKL